MDDAFDLFLKLLDITADLWNFVDENDLTSLKYKDTTTNLDDIDSFNNTLKDKKSNNDKQLSQQNIVEVVDGIGYERILVYTFVISSVVVSLIVIYYFGGSI